MTLPALYDVTETVRRGWYAGPMLVKRGNYWYGDDFGDLRKEMLRYALANGYPIARDYAPACACGGGVMKEAFGSGTFFIGADEEGDGAGLVCGNCSTEGFVADSQQFVDKAILEDEEFSECVCGKRDFHVVVAAAFYEASSDVRWWYVGGRCVHCSLVGVYADWKDDGAAFEGELRPRAKKKPTTKKATKKTATKKTATKKKPKRTARR